MVRWLVLWSAALLLPASAALADGDGPQRKMTAAEAEALGKLWTAIEESLPATPTNYIAQFTGPAAAREALTIPEGIPAERMLRMAFRKAYTLEPSLVPQTFADRAQGTPEQQARLAGLDAKVGELTDARDRSRDRDEKKRLRLQIQELEAEADALRETVLREYEEWVASGRMMTALQEAQERMPPKELVIRILVNEDVSISERAGLRSIPAANGPRTVFEEPYTFDLLPNSITVLLGPFEKRDKLSDWWPYSLTNQKRGLPTQARGMAITISGIKDVREATALLQAMDLERLEALVGGGSPSSRQ